MAYNGLQHWDTYLEKCVYIDMREAKSRVGVKIWNDEM